MDLKRQKTFRKTRLNVPEYLNLATFYLKITQDKIAQITQVWISQYVKINKDIDESNRKARPYLGSPGIVGAIDDMLKDGWEIATDKYVDEQGFPHPTQETPATKHKCTCNMQTIMAQGCRCGGV